MPTWANAISVTCCYKTNPLTNLFIYVNCLAIPGKLSADSADKLSACYVGTDAFQVTGRSEQTIVEKYQELGFNLTRADVGPGSRVRHGHALIDKLGRPGEGEDPTWYYVRETCPTLESSLMLVVEDPKNPEAPKKFDANSEGEGGDDV